MKKIPYFSDILLQAATGTIKYGYERDLNDIEFSNHARQSKYRRHDQLLSNLHSLYKESSDSNDSSESAEENNDINYNPTKEDKKEFRILFAEVTSANKFNNDGVLSMVMPDAKNESRYKRDITNHTATNETSTDDNVRVAAISTEKPATVTEKIEKVTVKNETALTEDSAVNRRRIFIVKAPSDHMTKTSKIKDKLLSYLEDTFNEVERKIQPLTNIKIALSNDDHYKIGYIVATIDTLEVNLKKMRNDMNLHQSDPNWDDEKILDLFDRIKSTNSVVTSLIELLKKYLPTN